jgi:isopenicillin N synthase-like dioxygenase
VHTRRWCITLHEGLQVKTVDGRWIEASPVQGSLVINIGDALERCTGGVLKATPHRVQQRAGAQHRRLSFPYFFDPSFDSPMTSLVNELPQEMQVRCETSATTTARWDGVDVLQFHGTYFDYLSKKVSAAIPGLATKHIPDKGCLDNSSH